MCLMYKERVQHSEDTPVKVYYTDRQGVPEPQALWYK